MEATHAETRRLPGRVVTVTPTARPRWIAAQISSFIELGTPQPESTVPLFKTAASASRGKSGARGAPITISSWYAACAASQLGPLLTRTAGAGLAGLGEGGGGGARGGAGLTSRVGSGGARVGEGSAARATGLLRSTAAVAGGGGAGSKFGSGSDSNWGLSKESWARGAERSSDPSAAGVWISAGMAGGNVPSSSAGLAGAGSARATRSLWAVTDSASA